MSRGVGNKVLNPREILLHFETYPKTYRASGLSSFWLDRSHRYLESDTIFTTIWIDLINTLLRFEALREILQVFKNYNINDFQQIKLLTIIYYFLQDYYNFGNIKKEESKRKSI